MAPAWRLTGVGIVFSFSFWVGSENTHSLTVQHNNQGKHLQQTRCGFAVYVLTSSSPPTLTTITGATASDDAA